MPLLCEAPPTRPALLEFGSISELYRLFEQLLLGDDPVIRTPCGHVISVYDHHFWHLVGVREKFSMKREKAELLRTTIGFGKYDLREGGARAKNLLSVIATYREPDEVREDNPRAKAKWVYLKEYNDPSNDHPFSVAFVDIETEGSSILVPTSRFSCDENGIRNKWQKGKLIYSRNSSATR